jgi:hypothetical protein
MLVDHSMKEVMMLVLLAIQEQDQTAQEETTIQEVPAPINV